MKTRTERYKNEHRAQGFLSWIFAGIIGLSLVLFVLLVWFSPVYVADSSMEPTLKSGDTIFYDRLYKHLHAPARGDCLLEWRLRNVCVPRFHCTCPCESGFPESQNVCVLRTQREGSRSFAAGRGQYNGRRE